METQEQEITQERILIHRPASIARQKSAIDEGLQLLSRAITAFRELKIGDFAEADIFELVNESNFFERAILRHIKAAAEGMPKFGNLKMSDEGLLRMVELPDATGFNEALRVLKARLDGNSELFEALTYFIVLDENGIPVIDSQRWEHHRESNSVYAETPQQIELYNKAQQVAKALESYEAYRKSIGHWTDIDTESVSDLRSPARQYMGLKQYLT